MSISDFEKNLGKAFLDLLKRSEGLISIDPELLEELSDNVIQNYDNDPDGVGMGAVMYVQGWMDCHHQCNVNIDYTLKDIIGFAREVINDNS